MATTGAAVAHASLHRRRWIEWLRGLLPRLARTGHADICNLPDHIKQDIGLIDSRHRRKRR